MQYDLSHVLISRKNKDVIVDGNKKIKLYVENHPKSEIMNEALNQARLEEGTDLNIPKLLEVTKINNRWALIFDFEEGTSLDKMMEEHPEMEDELLEKFIDTQMLIHTHKVPLLTRTKEKFKRKLENTDLIEEHTKYELLQRLEGMKNHTKVCHGDFNPSNIIVDKDGNFSIIDWAHVTQGNASADVARTFLLFSMEGKSELANKYLNRFSEKSGIEKELIQRWIPIVAATQLTKGIPEEHEFLSSWINVFDFQ